MKIIRNATKAFSLAKCDTNECHCSNARCFADN